MKRRNADCGKLRRPIKRNKITEGMYGSTTVLYMKFLVLWAIVITADFMFMFRFEFLWPFWLLLRSVHDSFKYKGLAFSVLFVCIAITSDLVCLFFIPVHWLLFAASTYVWVQYVWHTDKGICLPTIILWMLFVYLEAGIRWKDSRHMPHLDLCRPFAAHCIGYPVVTLGFGFKSYVGYRMRLRKQREVAKENEFYMQLLQQALPQEEPIADDAQLAAAATTTQSAQNLTLSSSTPTASIAVSASPNASTAMVTANGLLATQAQNHHHHMNNQHPMHEQQHTHHNSSGGTHSHSNSISSLAAVASSVGASSGGSATFNSDDNNYVQISGSSGGGGNASTPSSSHDTTTPISPAPLAPLAPQLNSTTNNNPINSLHLPSLNLSHCLSHNQQHQFDNNNQPSLTLPTISCNAHFNAKNALSNITSNGHIGGNIKNRRSMDKENKNKSNFNGSGDNEASMKHNKNNNYHQLQHENSNHHNNNNSSSGAKDKIDWDSGSYQVHQTPTPSQKEKSEESRAGSNSFRKVHANNVNATAATNGNVLQYDVDDVVVVEPVERTKGRRNRTKKDNASKDNHNHNHHHQNNNSSNSNNNSHSNTNSNHLSNHNQPPHKDLTSQNHNHTNNNHNKDDASSVSSSASSSSTSSSASSTASAASSTISSLASKVVSKICESCLKFEADIKKYRSEISHMKQIENELRQKLESNLTTKSCLQAKQKECDELEKRINELKNARHADILQLQATERRLTEERRQKQSLDAQLANEKKARKLAEEKAARPECSAQCKQRKQQMDEEIKLLRRDIKQAEDAKQMAEQHGRKWEAELRNFEAEIRNRDSTQPDAKLLMDALASIQDKNCTLEKNLSAETRVKLDLFSALGDAKRQLEISESRRRSKEEEVCDLRAKIAQLLAVMPTDPLSSAGSMLRMSDTPPLQAGPGPSSPMLSSLGAQQVSAVAGHQLSSRVSGPSSADFVQQAASDYGNSQQKQQCSGVVSVVVGNSMLTPGASPGGSAGGSNLDPNASIYTPKGGPGSGPGGVVVGGPSDA